MFVPMRPDVGFRLARDDEGRVWLSSHLVSEVLGHKGTSGDWIVAGNMLLTLAVFDEDGRRWRVAVEVFSLPIGLDC